MQRCAQALCLLLGAVADLQKEQDPHQLPVGSPQLGAGLGVEILAFPQCLQGTAYCADRVDGFPKILWDNREQYRPWVVSAALCHIVR